MNSEKKNIPALRFPEFTAAWCEKELGAMSEIIMGQSPDGDSYNSKGVGTALINGPVEFTERFPVKTKWTSKPTKFCRDKDIIFCVRGSTTGRMNIANDVYCIGRGVAAIRANKKSSSEFIESLITRNLAGILTLATGSTFFSLDSKSLREFCIYFPDLPEQQKIAAFLSGVDEKIGQLLRKKELLTKYKKGVMQQIFDQKIRFKDDNGNNFPDWEEKKLGEVFTFRSTNSFSRDNLNYVDGEVKNIHYGDIHTKFKTLFDITEERVPFINTEISVERIDVDNYCKKGDLIIADASEDYADVGKSIEIVNPNDEKVLAGLHTIHARPDLFEMESGFSGYLMKSRKVRLQIMTIAQGTKVLSISTGRLSKIELDIPSQAEQQKIADFLTAIDKKIDLVNTQLEKTKTFKKGLLQQMFV
ncbi:MAG: restriction endonuclease subunit S [Acidobacteria bacterium]|nr:restriction endonuclease subunit S [Acidobacteriota bacterium]